MTTQPHRQPDEASEPAPAGPAEGWDTATIRAVEDRHSVPSYAKLPLAFVRGLGCSVWDADGREYLDLYGGHCVALLGHGHPGLVQAISDQAGKLLFYSNVAYNDARARAVQALAALVPPALGQVFLCNSGAEANETALKIARRFTGRRRVLAMSEGFHGRTLGCLGATGLPGFRDPSWPIVETEHAFMTYGDAAALQAIDESVACVLLEPIPSMGGIQVADDAWFVALRERCDAAGALLVFDEVQTGFGRTGTPFFGEGVGVQPDLITGAKGAAGGVPAGVVFVRDSIAATIRPGDQGSTFGGGPLASAALEVVARTLLADGLPARAARLGRWWREQLLDVAGVLDVPGRGLLMGVDLDRPAGPVVAALRDQGLLVGGSKRPNQLRLLPPLIVTRVQAERFTRTLREVLATPSAEAAS